MTRLPLAAAPAAPAASLANPHLLGAALAGLLCLASCSTKDAPETSSNAAGETNQAAGNGATETGGSEAGGNGSVIPGGDSGGDATAAGGIAAGGAVDGAGAPGASGAATGGSAGTPAGGSSGAGGSGGTGGAAPEVPHITSSENVGVMTEEQFKALCDERGGTVEVMPHCGGFATAKGFSYDSSTELLSEHTCRGANTCGGWNCAIVD